MSSLARLRHRATVTAPSDQPFPAKTAPDSVRRTTGTPPSPEAVLPRESSAQTEVVIVARSLKQHRLVIQVGEYMVGGGVFFWTGYGSFGLLYSGVGINWLVAKMIADVSGWTASYYVQRYWAFSDKRLKGMETTVKRRYIIISVVDFAIDYVLVASLKAHGISPYIGFFVSAAVFTGWNYFWYRFWVFKPQRRS